MCITKQCEDPTEAGVWWREDDRWVKYSPDVAIVIKLAKVGRKNSKMLPLGVFQSNKYPAGCKYHLDLQSMEQVNSSSGYRREVKIVLKDGEETNLTEDKEVICAYFTDGQSEMLPRSASDAMRLIVAAAAGETKVMLENTGSGSSYFVVDLGNMKATEYEQGMCFSSRVISTFDVAIECLWEPDAAKATMDKNKTLQKKILIGLVKQLIHVNRLAELKEKHPPIEEIKPSENLEDAALNKFIDSLSAAIEKNKRIADELLVAAVSENLNSLKSIEFLFHTTHTDAATAALQKGFDVKRTATLRFSLDPMPISELNNAAAAAPSATILVLGVIATGVARNGSEVTFPGTKFKALLPVAEVMVP